MSLHTTLALGAIVGLGARLVAGSAYIGCFSPEALAGGGGVIYDNRTDSCPELVATGGLPYSNSWPYNGDQSPYRACRGWDVPLGSQYLVADRFCGYPNVNVTLVDPPTHWTWAGCWYLAPTEVWQPVASFSDCISSCESWPYAYGRYNEDLTISCLCSASQPPFDLPLDCGYGAPFWYTHPIQPSEFVRRQLKEKERLRREGQLALGLCPEGRTACRVPGEEDAGMGFECIDTDYEIESCGGCIHGELKLDATGTGPGTGTSEITGLE
ncbi:hypothetical protein I317_01370 [Kwoniella heveanensis CBS 569]|uniref:Uncharacterized protein n=1 Tax=Kwoniella heveanensis BCC8398 TaxID=1296120 RepID=A0A1B9GW51_9TREE|nr:hypothetical protein I316_02808 [Kwoniella heveanensis BCC8398]OCF44681.1 hypothetical protein I317_01370 [Kwoniella heveanensis CBS 569]